MADDDLGSLGGGLEDPETTPPEGPVSAPVLPQPVNQATMVCLRGPCVHLWRLLLRFDSSVKDVMTERCWTCLASPSKEFDLNDRHVYFCDRWWPRASLHDDDGKVLIKVHPIAARGHRLTRRRAETRPELHHAWERALVKLGYDFSWRDFDAEALGVDDNLHQRKFNAPGGLEAAREAAKPRGAGIPEDE